MKIWGLQFIAWDPGFRVLGMRVMQGVREQAYWASWCFLLEKYFEIQPCSLKGGMLTKYQFKGRARPQL